VLEDEEHDEQLVDGAKHDVVLAKLAEGSKVVDFGLARFKETPPAEFCDYLLEQSMDIETPIVGCLL